MVDLTAVGSLNKGKCDAVMRHDPGDVQTFVMALKTELLKKLYTDKGWHLIICYFGFSLNDS